MINFFHMMIRNIPRGVDAMQETRRYILNILRERGQATVDDIVEELRKRRGTITAVTVRHHLLRLQEEELITSPELRRRSTPGRPQHVYSLTEKAKEHFPNNYQRLASSLMAQVSQHLPPEGVNVIFEGIATCMADEACIPALPLKERLDLVVTYLDEHGYEATWEANDEGYILHTSNCPYHHINTNSNFALCEMDIRLISSLLNVVPRRISSLTAGDAACSYLIPSQ
jgi:predicted ArsR family transcriptional regulator